MKHKYKQIIFSLALIASLSLSLTGFVVRWTPEHSFFFPFIAILLVLWFVTGIFFALLHSSRARAVQNAREQDDVLKQIRILSQEVEFYEKRKNDLTMGQARRQQLAKAARELGALLDPALIQEKLIETARLIFPHRFIQITVGQQPDMVDQYVMERKQSLHLPKRDFASPPMLAAPVLSQGAVAGVMRVGGESEGAVFTQEELRMLEMLAGFASSALDNALLFSRVQENALRDNLTGLWTHKVFQDQLESDLLQASRFQQPLSVILADVDHFKTINDTFGHQAGDQVLQAVAAGLSRQVREVDFVARYGGEEFVVLLLDTPIEQAVVVAEAIRLNLEQQRLSVAGRVITVTASFGVASFPTDAVSAAQLVRKADERLYKAKHAGRNQVMGKAA
jgi:diguanylate cyclase (GGDEF)-like protein